MTVKHKGNQEYEGLSSDIKPLAADTALNAIFQETDTRNQYYNNGTNWILQTLPSITGQQAPNKYSIFKSGTTIKARNNITGIIDYTNTSGNIDPVLNSIINAISPAGTPTKIVIAEGDYKLVCTVVNR